MKENLTICYDFVFNLVVKRNGKTYKNHLVTSIGGNYDNAVWDAYFHTKKKRSEILKINSVRVVRIAFAIQNGKSISLKLVDYPPQIPEDLNSVLKYLPKKITS